MEGGREGHREEGREGGRCGWVGKYLVTIFSHYTQFLRGICGDSMPCHFLMLLFSMEPALPPWFILQGPHLMLIRRSNAVNMSPRETQRKCFNNGKSKISFQRQDYTYPEPTGHHIIRQLEVCGIHFRRWQSSPRVHFVKILGQENTGLPGSSILSPFIDTCCSSH